jgi:hypothetical protein
MSLFLPPVSGGTGRNFPRSSILGACRNKSQVVWNITLLIAEQSRSLRLSQSPE